MARESKRAAGRPSELTGAWAELVDAAGGPLELCELLGVHKATLYRWIKGESPIAMPARIAIETVAKKLRVSPPSFEE